MVKFATSLILAAAIAAPTFALVNDNVETRDFLGPAEEDLYTRDLSIEARNPAQVDDIYLSTRDVQELDELSERDIDELAEREPFFGALLRVGAKAIGKVVSHRNRNRNKRDLSDEEVFARFFSEELSERDVDIDELAEREPFFGALFRVGAKVIGKVVSHRNRNKNKRDLSDEEVFARFFSEELSERDFDIQELAEREPLFFGALLRGGAKAIGKIVSHRNHNKNKRDLLDEDIYERNFDDELFEREVSLD